MRGLVQRVSRAEVRVDGAVTGAIAAGYLVLVAATQGAPEGVQLIAAGVRDLGFAGMGAALLAPAPAARPRLG